VTSTVSLNLHSKTFPVTNWLITIRCTCTGWSTRCVVRAYEWQLMLRCCGNFELIKFCRNFVKSFCNISEKNRPPPPPYPPREKETREMLYTALCKFDIFAKIWIIPLEILRSTKLNHFNGSNSMFNCVQVIWFGLCDTNRIYVIAKFCQNFTNP